LSTKFQNQGASWESWAKEATHPRCYGEGYPDWPGRVSNKVGEPWTVGAPSGVDGNGPKRFSVQCKMAIIARLLRGKRKAIKILDGNLDLRSTADIGINPKDVHDAVMSWILTSR
jgi:hypothetical protein